MIGRAGELRSGDTLITSDGTTWPIDRVDHGDDGIRLRVKDFPFPWRYAQTELVVFTRPVEDVPR